VASAHGGWICDLIFREVVEKEGRDAGVAEACERPEHRRPACSLRERSTKLRAEPTSWSN
jgi:hypothetical protein